MLDTGGGAVVNISSIMGRVSGPGYLAYGTAKAALAHYTDSRHVTSHPRIRVNAIAVGSVATSALEFVVQDDEVRSAMEERRLCAASAKPTMSPRLSSTSLHRRRRM